MDGSSNEPSNSVADDGNRVETFEFDESDVTQLKSRQFGRRRRVAYGRRGTFVTSASSSSLMNASAQSFVLENPVKNQRNDDSSSSENTRMALSAHRKTGELNTASSRLGGVQRSSSLPIVRNTETKSSARNQSAAVSQLTRNENAHPNLIRRESINFGSSSSSSPNCFSTISRSASGQGSMASTTNTTASLSSKSSNTRSISNDTNALEVYSSPPRSNTFSRKRGVCDSPVVHADDLMSNGGISISRHSTSSYGSRRARSRIFSPDSTKKMIEASLALDTNDLIPIYGESSRKRDGLSFHDTDSEEEDPDTSMCLLSNSIDVEANEDADECQNENSIDLGVPPNRLRRMSSVGNTFEEAIFAPVEMKQGARAHDQVFSNMSCYDDLKFLIRELRKWNSGKQAVIFGSIRRLCTVVPPKQWGHQRKIAFNEWATTHLGFCHRSGGGMVTYLQTSQANGKKVLKTLEAALLSYKESSKTERVQHSRVSCVQPRLPLSSVKLMRRSVSTPMIPSLRNMSLTSPSLIPNVRPSLTRSFRRTPIAIDKPSPMSNSVGDIASKFESMDILDNKNDYLMESEDNTSVRRFSIESTERNVLQRIVTLPNEDKISIGRPSHDNSFTHSGDFMSQIGISPLLNTKEHVRPPARILSMEKNEHLIHTMSPCLESNPILAIDASCCVETPMPKYDYRNWGSRPLQGRDWGISAQCDNAVIQDLKVKLEIRCANMTHKNECYAPPYPVEEEEASDGEFHCISNEPNIPQPSLELSTLPADSVALGFDIEQKADDSAQYQSDKEDVGENLSHNYQIMEHNNLNLSPRLSKRREKSIAKRTRVSICESSLSSPRPYRLSSIKSRTTFLHYENATRSKMGMLETLEESAISRVKVPSPSGDDVNRKIWSNQNVLLRIFSFLSEYDLLCKVSLVSTAWADVATHAHASLVLISVGCSASFAYSEDPVPNDSNGDGDFECLSLSNNRFVPQSMMRSWDYLVTRFPWGTFLSEGAFKRVYKVWNARVGAEEALSVMDVEQIDNINVVGSELAVSVMLSSMVRRNICPNFVLVRGIFTSEYKPSASLWGCADNKAPQGKDYDPHRTYKKPRQPSKKSKGSFQYIRMELCKHGDLEEYIKRQTGSVLSPCDSRALLFQMAFSLHVAGNKFGMKHYDVKLLNFFVDDTNHEFVDPERYPHTVLQYGLGSHVFNVRMKTKNAITVKLADFGTANMRAETNGQPVLIGNFTTLENTPPDYLILGDAATQGYGHDCFGLGLCMLHLFTGYAPYEEILQPIRCPPNLKKKLRSIWESNKPNGYEVIKNVIRCDVLEDEDGNIIEGLPDDTLYDTLYRFLVLFGIPNERFELKDGSRVWTAIDSCIGSDDVSNTARRSKRNISSYQSRKEGPDFAQYIRDCNRFSIHVGDNQHIARARNTLKRFNGGMDLLLSLVSFDPKKRASPLDVMNSSFMEPLRDRSGASEISDDDIVYSYMSYSF